MADRVSLVDELRAEQTRKSQASSLSPWGQQVVERAQELRDHLIHVEESQRQHLSEMLDAANWLASYRVPLWRGITRLSDWWFGSRVERAWSYLHEAERLFVEHADDKGFEIALDSALGHAQALAPTDPVRQRYEEFVATWPGPKDEQSAGATPAPPADATPAPPAAATA